MMIKKHIMFACSTLDSDFNDIFQGKFNRKNKEAAEHLGKSFAERLLKNDIRDNLIFDKGGYAYKGTVVETLSESMRNSGLIFLGLL